MASLGNHKVHASRLYAPAGRAKSSHFEEGDEVSKERCDAIFSHVARIWDTDKWQTVKFGKRGTLLHRMIFVDRLLSREISPWHKIPLYGGAGQLSFICCTPRGSWGQFELAQDEPLSPLRIRAKRGRPAHYRENSPWNIGLLPQTWGDPELASEDSGFMPYNGCPLDVIDIGSKSPYTGEVYSVKPLAAFAVLEMKKKAMVSWKILAVDTEDPLAAELADVSDIRRTLPGVLEEIREWFRSAHCVEQEDTPYTFALDEQPVGCSTAVRVVAETHGSWQLLEDLFSSRREYLPGKPLKPEDYEARWQIYTAKASQECIPLSDLHSDPPPLSSPHLRAGSGPSGSEIEGLDWSSTGSTGKWSPESSSSKSTGGENAMEEGPIASQPRRGLFGMFKSKIRPSSPSDKQQPLKKSSQPEKASRSSSRASSRVGTVSKGSRGARAPLPSPVKDMSPDSSRPWHAESLLPSHGPSSKQRAAAGKAMDFSGIKPARSRIAQADPARPGGRKIERSPSVPSSLWMEEEEEGEEPAVSSVTMSWEGEAGPPARPRIARATSVPEQAMAEALRDLEKEDALVHQPSFWEGGYGGNQHNQREAGPAARQRIARATSVPEQAMADALRDFEREEARPALVHQPASGEGGYGGNQHNQREAGPAARQRIARATSVPEQAMADALRDFEREEARPALVHQPASEEGGYGGNQHNQREAGPAARQRIARATSVPEQAMADALRDFERDEARLALVHQPASGEGGHEAGNRRDKGDVSFELDHRPSPREGLHGEDIRSPADLPKGPKQAECSTGNSRGGQHSPVAGSSSQLKQAGTYAGSLRGRHSPTADSSSGPKQVEPFLFLGNLQGQRDPVADSSSGLERVDFPGRWRDQPSLPASLGPQQADTFSGTSQDQLSPPSSLGLKQTQTLKSGSLRGRRSPTADSSSGPKQAEPFPFSGSWQGQHSPAADASSGLELGEEFTGSWRDQPSPPASSGPEQAEDFSWRDQQSPPALSGPTQAKKFSGSLRSRPSPAEDFSMEFTRSGTYSGPLRSHRSLAADIPSGLPRADTISGVSLRSRRISWADADSAGYENESEWASGEARLSSSGLPPYRDRTPSGWDGEEEGPAVRRDSQDRAAQTGGRPPMASGQVASQGWLQGTPWGASGQQQGRPPVTRQGTMPAKTLQRTRPFDKDGRRASMSAMNLFDLQQLREATSSNATEKFLSERTDSGGQRDREQEESVITATLVDVQQEGLQGGSLPERRCKSGVLQPVAYAPQEYSTAGGLRRSQTLESGFSLQDGDYGNNGNAKDGQQYEVEVRAVLRRQQSWTDSSERKCWSGQLRPTTRERPPQQMFSHGNPMHMAHGVSAASPGRESTASLRLIPRAQKTDPRLPSAGSNQAREQIRRYAQARRQAKKSPPPKSPVKDNDPDSVWAEAVRQLSLTVGKPVSLELTEDDMAVLAGGGRSSVEGIASGSMTHGRRSAGR